MTRQEIYQHIAANCGDTFGTAGNAEIPFAYQKLVTQAFDELARRSRCYWKTSTMPLQANVAQFGSPQILEMQALTMFTSDGNPHLVDPATTAAMDDWAGVNWRNQVAGGQVYTAIMQGLNSGVLNPAPNFNSQVYSYVDLVLGSGTDINGNAVSTVSSVARSFVNAAAPAGDVNLFLNIPSPAAAGFTPGWYRIVSVDNGKATLSTLAGTSGSANGSATLTSGGLWMEGLGVPGSGTWDALTAECPLPEVAHMTGVWLACQWRAARNPTPENQVRLPLFDKWFTDGLAALLVEVKTFTYASRVPALVGLDDAAYLTGGWDPTYGNPLNM
jgi:hypothetical protein